MLIVCPSCATGFRVKEGALGPGGRQVRCAQCRTVWHAREPSAEAVEPANSAGRATAAPTPVPTPRPVPAEPPRQAAAPPPPEPSEDDWAAALDESARKPEAVTVEEPLPPATESPPIAPQTAADPLPPKPEPAPVRRGIEAAASRNRRRRPVRPPGPSRPGLRMSLPVTIVLLGTALLATFFLGREQVVRTVPDAAGVYEAVGLPVNLRGVDFRDVVGAREIVDGVEVLVVEGRLVNITGRTVDLARLRLAVRDGEGREIYTWTATPPQPQLGPGEAVPFRSRLASPPAEGRSLQVRFFTRVDAGGR